MILISGFEIEYSIRNRIGTSLIIWLTLMVLLNFVLWMSTTVRNVKLSCRKLRFKRAMKRINAKKQLKSKNSPTILSSRRGLKQSPSKLPSIAEGDSDMVSSTSQSFVDNKANIAIESQPAEDVVQITSEADEDASFLRIKGLIYGNDIEMHPRHRKNQRSEDLQQPNGRTKLQESLE